MREEERGPRWEATAAGRGAVGEGGSKRGIGRESRRRNNSRKNEHRKKEDKMHVTELEGESVRVKIGCVKLEPRCLSKLLLSHKIDADVRCYSGYFVRKQGYIFGLRF